MDQSSEMRAARWAHQRSKTQTEVKMEARLHFDSNLSLGGCGHPTRETDLNRRVTPLKQAYSEAEGTLNAIGSKFVVIFGG